MSDTKDTSNSNYDENFHFDEVDPAASDYMTSHTAGLDDQPGSNDAKSRLGDHAFFDDPFSKSSNKWAMQPSNARKFIILGLVIVLVLFFIAYHFISSWTNPLSGLHHARSEHNAQSATATLPSAEQIARAAQQEKLAEAKAQADALDAKFDAINQTINQQQQTITQLQSNIETLQASVNALTTSVATATEKLAVLDNKVIKPTNKATRPAMAPPPVTYFVRAMVPGRAWLQASNGTTLSVAVGNEVPGHGTVASVALSSGQVVMSDGSVFTYNIDGN
jgi:uncharacterized coiled-coil protein SlyX